MNPVNCLLQEPLSLFSCREEVRFMSIGSGSSGNSYVLTSSQGAILLDVGLPLRTIAKALKSIGLEFGMLSAVLVTHSHSDHVRCLSRLSQLYNLPLYASAETFINLDKRKNDKPIRQGCRFPLEPFVSIDIAGFKVESLPISHDSGDCVGFFIQRGCFKLLHLSDVGCYRQEHYDYAKRANHIVLEANYDKNMLYSSAYPLILKQRIMGSGGHTSNEEAALFLKEVYSTELKKVWLCHLSKENNSPDCCLSTFDDVLSDHIGSREVLRNLIEILPRLEKSSLYSFAMDSEFFSQDI